MHEVVGSYFCNKVLKLPFSADKCEKLTPNELFRVLNFFSKDLSIKETDATVSR